MTIMYCRRTPVAGGSLCFPGRERVGIFLQCHVRGHFTLTVEIIDEIEMID